MKRIGVLGGISPQATMDFEARVHRVAQRTILQDWNRGYPPMVVWYHRRLPVRVGEDERPVVPMEVDPQLVEAAAWLGKVVDFIVISCNSAHLGVRAISAAAGCPVLSMIDLTLNEITRRGWTRPGVIGFNGPPRVYLDPLEQRGMRCATIDTDLQVGLDGGIRAVAEGRESPADSAAAGAAGGARPPAGVVGHVGGGNQNTHIVGGAGEAGDLVNPLALLAEATVRFAIADAPAPLAAAR